MRIAWFIVTSAAVAFGIASPALARTATTTDLPKSQQELPTTSPGIYLGNLDERFRDAVRRMIKDPDVASVRKTLSKLEHLRGQYFADPHGVMRAIGQASKCLELVPDDTECLLLRARQRLSLHRFEQAQLDLERAKKLGSDPVETAAIQQELDWNAGCYQEAIAAIRQAAASRPNLGTLARLARLEDDLGNVDAAEQAFQAAEDAFADVDPFSLAWLNVQRGLHYFEQGQVAQALPFYQEAVRRLPDYVLASEHLAEALALLGNVDEATERYERIVSLTPHAESLAALGRIYRMQGRVTKADTFKRKATDRYEALLRAYPEAMQQHAAQFFLDDGEDPKRALTLLERNLALRPTSESWWALAKAQLAMGHEADACQSRRQAINVSPVRDHVKRTSIELFETCSRDVLN